MKNQGTRFLKSFLFGLLLLSGIQPAQSQCNWSVLLQYQHEVDSFPFHFPGCHDWGGFIEIHAQELQNLDSLIQLETIQGDLLVSLFVSELSDFSGFDSLKYVGQNFLVDAGGETPFDGQMASEKRQSQQQVEVISGFNNLEVVDGDFRIGSSSTFRKIVGFDKLHKVTGDFQLSEMPGDSIIGFNQLDSIMGNMEFRYLLDGPVEFDAFHNLCYIGGDLIIHGCDFQDLSWTNMIKFIGGDIIISFNGNMPEVKGFNMLSHLGGNLEIEYNSKLASVDGFNHLESFGGSFSLFNNDSLKSIQGFNALNSLEQSLILEGASITQLSGFQQLQEINGNLEIVNNDSLVTIEAFEQLKKVDSLIISNNEKLAYLPAFKIQGIVGSLDVNNNPSLLSLEGLDSVTSIGYNLSLMSNAQLQNLGGLKKLDSIGHDFQIISNPDLTTLQDLTDLRFVGNEFMVVNNDHLATLNTTLEYIGGVVRIGYNEALTSLSFITSPEMNGNLLIYANPLLADLSGLDSLTHIRGDLSLNSNNALQSLQGLDQLAIVGGYFGIFSSNLDSLDHLNSLDSIHGSLQLIDNENLSNIKGLQHLRTVGENLVFRDNKILNSLEGIDQLRSEDLKGLNILSNQSLSDCARESICHYLQSGGLSQIILNAPGCNTEDEIIDICLVSTSETGTDQKIILFPNPAKDHVEISGKNISNFVIRLIDSFGHPVSAPYQDGILRIGHLSPGLYCVLVQSNHTSKGLLFTKI